MSALPCFHDGAEPLLREKPYSWSMQRQSLHYLPLSLPLPLFLWHMSSRARGKSVTLQPPTLRPSRAFQLSRDEHPSVSFSHIVPCSDTILVPAASGLKRYSDSPLVRQVRIPSTSVIVAQRSQQQDHRCRDGGITHHLRFRSLCLTPRSQRRNGILRCLYNSRWSRNDGWRQRRPDTPSSYHSGQHLSPAQVCFRICLTMDQRVRPTDLSSHARWKQKWQNRISERADCPQTTFQSSGGLTMGVLHPYDCKSLEGERQIHQIGVLKKPLN